jgi:hypothetical protein
VTRTESGRNEAASVYDFQRGFGPESPRFGTERPLVRIQSPRPQFLGTPQASLGPEPEPIGIGRARSVPNRGGNGTCTESDPDQLDLSFHVERRQLPPHPVVILRWRDGGVAASWPDFGLNYWFPSWPKAFEAVLHPINHHVRVKVSA